MFFKSIRVHRNADAGEGQGGGGGSNNSNSNTQGGDPASNPNGQGTEKTITLTEAQYNAQLKQARLSAQKKARTALATDEEFVSTILEANKDRLKPQAADPANDARKIEDAQKAWEAQKLTPVQQENETLRKQLSTYQQKAVASSVLQGANEAGFDTSDPVVAEWITAKAAAFGIDEESNDLGMRDGDGFKYGANGRPLSPREYFLSLAKDASYAKYLVQRQQAGPGARPGQGGVTRIDSKSAASFWGSLDDLADGKANIG